MHDRSSTPPLAAVAILALVAAVPIAGAHAGSALVLEAREGQRCLDNPVCLELAAVPPDLGPEHETSLELRTDANASRSYTVALTTIGEADPDREATPLASAIATTGPVEPGENGSVNLTTPRADELYLWLPEDDHEARGGWETLVIDPRSAEEGPSGPQTVDGVGLALLAVLGLAAVVARRTKR